MKEMQTKTRHKCKNCGHDLNHSRGIYGHRHKQYGVGSSEKARQKCRVDKCDCELPEKKEENTHPLREYDGDGSPY